jgi:hypothetical protein
VRGEKSQAGIVFAPVHALNVWLAAGWILYHAPVVEWLTEGRGSDVRTPPLLQQYSHDNKLHSQYLSTAQQDAEDSGSTGNASDFYSVRTRFESRPKHRIS